MDYDRLPPKEIVKKAMEAVMSRGISVEFVNIKEDAIKRILSQTDDLVKKEFAYFKNFMINLNENITNKEFEKDLADYLTRMIELVK